MASSRTAPLVLLLLAGLCLGAPSADAGPPIGERDVVTIGVTPLDVPVVETSGELTERRVDPRSGATLRATIAWPGPSDRSALRVEARERPGTGDERRIALEAVLELPDGRSVRTGRTVVVTGERTTLVELHRDGRRALTLAVHLRLDREPYVDTAPTPGRAVRMLLEIQRVDGGVVSPLETNQLQSFVGRSVGYSFRIADTRGDTHAVRVRLAPQVVRGALATIRVDVEGSLPGETGPAVVARSESLVISRGATSTLAVETGSPPSGYRFLVTALF